jgi:hypothetical protein
VDSHWQRKTEVFVDKPVRETICPPQTPHQLIQSKPGPRGERPASTDRMSPERGHKYRSVLRPYQTFCMDMQFYLLH